MSVHEDAACFGYFGFGAGYELGTHRLTPAQASRIRPDGATYCHAACPHSAACWEVHRRRVRGLFPDAMADFDRLVVVYGQGPAVVEAWWHLYGCAPPDLSVMAGNLEDGLSVGVGGHPRQRGAGSLTWPLTPVQPRES